MWANCTTWVNQLTFLYFSLTINIANVIFITKFTRFEKIVYKSVLKNTKCHKNSVISFMKGGRNPCYFIEIWPSTCMPKNILSVLITIHIMRNDIELHFNSNGWPTDESLLNVYLYIIANQVVIDVWEQSLQ